MDHRPADEPPLHRVEPATPQEVWLTMSDLVLDHQRRRDVAQALGMTFNRARAVRRLARQPMTMGQLAAALDIDPPNATMVVDDLQAQGLVRRRPHPTDRRTKIVELTPQGDSAAQRADQILAAPPPALNALSPEDLNQLRRILATITGTT
jgi:DNA-binding MarR family transcriptional regulator